MHLMMFLHHGGIRDCTPTMHRPSRTRRRRGVDIGPVCSSVLVKLCAQRRDLPMALDIFHRLSGQSTLNR